MLVKVTHHYLKDRDIARCEYHVEYSWHLHHCLSNATTESCARVQLLRPATVASDQSSRLVRRL